MNARAPLAGLLLLALAGAAPAGPLTALFEQYAASAPAKPAPRKRSVTNAGAKATTQATTQTAQLPAATTAVGAALSAPARQLLAWVQATADNEGAPFVVIDKQQARLWAFDAQGRVQASSPVLLGAARGDVSVPGIGERPIKDILPHERTTPAGRFIGEPGHNAAGEDIVWVDYDAAVSMHRVRATNPVERRLQRLASATPADNRISYGCINVPARFYDRHIRPRFSVGHGVVYLLPETRPPSALFNTAPLRTAHVSKPL